MAKAPITDRQALGRFLERPVSAVHCEHAMGMTRVVAIEFENGVQFPVPAGNALRTAGDIIEVRALLAGVSRELAEALKRQVGDRDPEQSLADAEWLIMETLAEPETALARAAQQFPLARPGR